VTPDDRFLIVGAGPAGLAAARAYRDAGGDGSVALIGDEGRLPYQRPPLTKDLLRGESSEAELPLEPETWFEDNAVDLIAARAVALDPEHRSVLLSGGREVSYGGWCLLATGAEPARLPVPGVDHPRVRVVRTLDHLRELTTALPDAATVVVIGSGFIGCEIAASLRMRGHDVHLVSDEAAPNENRLGQAAPILAEWLADDGVKLHLGAPVERVDIAGGGVTVRAGDESLTGQLVVMATGVSPRLELAQAAGLDVADGAIPVDAAMRTARDGILAAGDVCRAQNLAAGRRLRVEHWGDALGQGEVAGRTAAGVEAGWDAVPGFWSTIGRRTLKYAAWGDGFDGLVLHRDDDGSFTAWYGLEGTIVGVLTHEHDHDYDAGRQRIAKGASWPP